MTFEHKWGISQLDVAPEIEGRPAVVCTVHWHINANEGELLGYAYGATQLEFKEDATFIPFDQLTFQQVVNWVQETLGPEEVDKLFEALHTQIDNQKAPAIINPPLPWETSE